jgi:hypothetical protein
MSCANTVSTYEGRNRRLSRQGPRCACRRSTLADYAVGSAATPITPAEATVAIATATRFGDIITQLLPQA